MKNKKKLNIISCLCVILVIGIVGAFAGKNNKEIKHQKAKVEGNENRKKADSIKMDNKKSKDNDVSPKENTTGKVEPTNTGETNIINKNGKVVEESKRKLSKNSKKVSKKQNKSEQSEMERLDNNSNRDENRHHSSNNGNDNKKDDENAEEQLDPGTELPTIPEN